MDPWILYGSHSKSRAESETYRVDKQFGHSEEGWRKLIRAAWINAFLVQRRIHGGGVGTQSTPSSSVKSSSVVPIQSVFLSLKEIPRKPVPQSSSGLVNAVAKRDRRGCCAKPIIRALISDPEQWFEIQ